ncbi:unnamed protein product [Symbiodinium sp. CCMP2592]|nr:unnamed protein product [Symbiodinium sp. CCMP2592]CAE7417269.1 unnamed protein product [Symbiodinium sp. CCMP2592]
MIPGFRVRTDGADSVGSPVTVSEPARSRETCRPLQAEAGDDCHAIHAMACRKRGCTRCAYVRNQDSWHARCPAGISGQTWLLPQMSGDRFSLACWVCKAAGQDSEWTQGVETKLVGNLQRHNDSAVHRAALLQLGLVQPEESDVVAGAPTTEAFLLVLQRRLEGRSLKKAEAGVGAEKKLQKLQLCLAGALTAMDRAFLADATCVSLFQDVRDHKLMIRFKACDERLQLRSGVIAYEDLQLETGTAGTIAGLRRALHKFYCDIDGSFLQQDFDKMCSRVEFFCSDAAADERLCGRVLLQSGLFPKMRYQVFDKAHACGRLLKRPWQSNDKLWQVVQNFALGQHSLAHRVQYSPHLARVFQHHCTLSETRPIRAERIRSLSFAKHRFGSVSKPLGRSILFIEAVIETNIWITLHRAGEEEAEAASTWLAAVTEEDLLLAALCADAADELMVFLRKFDKENWDTSQSQFWVVVFVSRLHHLFNQDNIWNAAGYTNHMLKVLETTSFGMVVQGHPKSIGGQKISNDLKRRCRLELQSWVVLLVDTLKTEFPHYELLSSMQVFHLSSQTQNRLDEVNPDSPQETHRRTALRRIAAACRVSLQELMDEFSDHLPIAQHLAATQGLESWEAWREAVLRTQARPSVKQNHPADKLKAALCRFGAMNCSTSGIEQLFSQIMKQTGHSRSNLSDESLFAEVKIFSDAKNSETHPSLVRGAQAVWTAWFGAERQTTRQRVDAGKPKQQQAGSESAWLCERRKVPAVLVDVDRVADTAWAAAEERFDQPMFQELEFQRLKRYRNLANAFLAQAVTEEDVPEELIEVAQYFAEADAHNETARKAKRQKLHSIMAPTPPRLQSSRIWLECHDEWLNQVPAGLAQNVVAEMHEATLFVVANANRIPPAVHWSAMMRGYDVVNLQFLSSSGAAGVAFNFDPSFSIRRSVLVSEEFWAAEPELAAVVELAMAAPNSKWRELHDWDEFAEKYEATAGPHLPATNRKPKQVIALTTREIKDEMQMDSVMCREDFQDFLSRVACTKRSLCGA